MSYIHPEEVLSPKQSVEGIIEVIHDPGPGGMSVAKILWCGEEWLATRWNGTDKQPKGNPVSHGQPTWHLMDKYAQGAIEAAARKAAEQSPNSLISKYREMANDSAREQEAEDWSEALINDGTSQR